MKKFRFDKGKKQLMIAFPLFFLLSFFSHAVPGVSYDLSNSVTDVVGGSQITEVVADSERNIVYFGTIDGKLGYYNATSNTSTDLTSTVSGFVAGEFWGMTLDTTDNRLYFSVGQINNEVGYYELATNTSTHLPLASFIFFTKLLYDKDRDVIWYASNDGDLGFISKLNDTKCPAGVTGGWVADICLDDFYDRLYIYYIAASKFPEYYAIGNQTQVDLSANHPMDVNSCAIDQENHRIYMGAYSAFTDHYVYFEDNDTVSSVFTTGDTAGTPKTVYIPYNNLVAFIEYSGFGDGRIYNVSAMTPFLLQDTDDGDWMAPYFMDAADYNNVTNFLYIGFTGGGFGYYNNDFYVPPVPPFYFNLSSIFLNHSKINISNISNYEVIGRYISSNISTVNITLYLNGTYEDSVIASNDTDFALHITNINETGYYVIRLQSPYTNLVYYFRVVETIPDAFIGGSALIAIAMLLISSVAIMTLLGITTSNDMLKLLLCSMSVLGLVGLSFLAYNFADHINAPSDMMETIWLFPLIFMILSVFIFIYTAASFVIYVIQLFTRVKKDGLKGVFKIEVKDDEYDLYK